MEADNAESEFYVLLGAGYPAAVAIFNEMVRDCPACRGDGYHGEAQFPDEMTRCALCLGTGIV